MKFTPANFIKADALFLLALSVIQNNEASRQTIVKQLSDWGLPVLSEATFWRLASSMVDQGHCYNSGSNRWRSYGLTQSGMRLAEAAAAKLRETYDFGIIPKSQSRNPARPQDATAGVAEAGQGGDSVILDTLDTLPGVRNSKPVGYNFAFLDRYIPNQGALFTDDELNELFRIGHHVHDSIAANGYYKRISEKLIIDFSFASSKLEGVKFDYLDTENLILHNFAAPDADPKDVQIILNHKKSIEFMLAERETIQPTSFDLRSIHSSMMTGILHESRCGTVRTHSVDIRGVNYQPLRVPAQLESEFSKLSDKASKVQNPFEASLLLMAGLSYLQFFHDGNKRTARLAANIPLFNKGMCPMSFMDVNRRDYKRGLADFYERQDLTLLKRTFIDGYRRSNELYMSAVLDAHIPEVKTNPERDQIVVECVRYYIQQTVQTNSLDEVRDVIGVVLDRVQDDLNPGDEAEIIDVVTQHLEAMREHKFRNYGLSRSEITAYMDMKRAESEKTHGPRI